MPFGIAWGHFSSKMKTTRRSMRAMVADGDFDTINAVVGRQYTIDPVTDMAFMGSFFYCEI